jgi:hypothetical protein
MAKYLRIDPSPDPETGGPGGANYRLPADVDVLELARTLADSLAGGGSVFLPVELEDQPVPRAFIVVNGSAVRHVLITETEDDAAQS